MAGFGALLCAIAVITNTSVGKYLANQSDLERWERGKEMRRLLEKDVTLPSSVDSTPAASRTTTFQSVLSREWSPAVRLKPHQSLSWKIAQGKATVIEVRNPDDPYSRIISLTPDDHFENPMRAIQWRISGEVITSPVILEYTVGD